MSGALLQTRTSRTQRPEPRFYCGLRPSISPPERTLTPEEPIVCPCGTTTWTLWGDSHWSRWPREDDADFYAGAVFATLLDSPLVVPPVEGRTPRPLAAVLADMLLLTGGREFLQLRDAFAPGSVPRGGSAVVWELLLRTALNEHRRAWTRGDETIWNPDRDQVRFTDEEDLPAYVGDDQPAQGGIAVLRLKVDGREAAR